MRPMPTTRQRDLTCLTERLQCAANTLSRARQSEQHILSAANQLVRTFQARGKMVTIGNGGSAAQAQHFAAECLGRYSVNRNALPAIALSADSAAVTSISNDLGYELVFVRQIEALGAEADTLVAFSTSGNSLNIIRSIQTAKNRGMATILMTGAKPHADAVAVADIVISTPAESTALIQECHLAIVHVLMEMVEFKMFGIELPQVAPRITTIQDLLPLRETWRNCNLPLVWTNGCFDLLHAGHVKSLAEAKDLGGILVVGVNSDESVRRLKGDGRPIYDLKHRQEILASLSAVDYVVTLNDDDPRSALAALQPDIHFKGGDYLDPSGMIEKSMVDQIGARVVLGQYWNEWRTSRTIDTIVERDGLY